MTTTPSTGPKMNHPPEHPAQAQVDARTAPDTCDTALAATGGLAGPLRAYAAAEGISLSHARMRWYQTGLPSPSGEGLPWMS